MQKHFVRAAMGFTYGILFCLLFGAIGLGINTWIDHNQSDYEVKVIEGDTVWIRSDTDIAAVIFSTSSGLTLSHKYQKLYISSGKSIIQIEDGEYTVLFGEGNLSTSFGNTIFNSDDFLRKIKLKNIITIASLLSGFVLGFLLGVILDSEEKPRQKFIGE